MPEPEISLLLKNSTIYDGTGTPHFTGHVGVCSEIISFIKKGNLTIDYGAERVIDLKGLCLCPGFIDTHGHSDFTLLATPSAEGKVLQGITTEVGGNCGLSAFPLYGEALKRRENELSELRIEDRWDTFQEYFGLLEEKGIALNFATLIGHGNMWASVMGYVDRRPSAAERDNMKNLLEKAIEAGAIGFSTGLIYPPGIYAYPRDLSELVRHGLKVSGENFLYASHIRSEGKRLIESIQEIVNIGRETGAPVHISHIKTAGKENWHKISEVIEIIEGARHEGIQVTCDRYPYTASSTDLDSMLPPWTYEGGAVEEIGRLMKPDVRDRIGKELLERTPDWEGVILSTVFLEKNRWMEGKSIARISREQGKGELDTFFDILIEESLRVGAVFHSMCEENLQRFLSLPYTMVGTDSSARPLKDRGKPHPRGFGSFPRYLKRYASSLEDGINKITMLPARTFGLERRGVIQEGYYADLVIFDPVRLEDRATYEEPFRAPAGINSVFLNGKAVVMDGRLTGQRPGKVLRNGRG